MAYLTIEGVSKTYEGKPLLNNVSLDVERGEIISFLGPSGSGKTTLLRIVAGLETPEAGRILLADQDMSHVPVHRRGVVLMFQDYALFPHRTVQQNVAFGLRMLGLPKPEIRARVKVMLALVGLQDFGPRSVVDLSGGERQRVALARSLAPQPRLLLLDEPLGSLDRTLRERLLEELAAILRRVRVTTIAVTHDQAEAFALADRVALLHDARFVQVATPQTIYAHPATPWVARFLGYRNLLPARVTDDGRLETAFGKLDVSPELSLPETGIEGTVLILPWGIRIIDSEPPCNAFAARIVQRVFQGSTTVVRLQVGEVSVSVVMDSHERVPQEGDWVAAWVSPDALRWFAPPIPFR
ncbi:MAG: ABC transporter ATP-binding protein [Anaerolineae bacterium]|jgi:ABC-type Fe3+/spermidine/putrescine transport system ATPase subunit|nr:ABC transporter ATP-binding protein [Anaerolineae bacterium]